MALVVAKNPSTSEHRRKLLFDPNADHVTDIDAVVAVSAAARCCVTERAAAASTATCVVPLALLALHIYEYRRCAPILSYIS